MDKIIVTGNNCFNLFSIKKWLLVCYANKVFDLKIITSSTLFARAVCLTIENKNVCINSIEIETDLKHKTSTKKFIAFLKRLHKDYPQLLVRFKSKNYISKKIGTRLNQSLLPIVIHTNCSPEFECNNLEIIENERDNLFFDYFMWKSKSSFLSCEHSSCLGKTIYIKNKKEIRMCHSLKPMKLPSTAFNFEDAFSDDELYALLKESIDKREKCIKDCLFYSFCKSGCPIKINECKKEVFKDFETSYNKLNSTSIITSEILLRKEIKRL